MAYKHVIRANTKNLMTDEMFISAGFTKQPDGSWYVPKSTVLNNKVLWENTEGIAGPLIISLYGKSPQPNAAGIMQFLVTFTDGDIQYINGTGSSDVWEYSVPIVPNPTKTIAKIDWVNITGRPLYLRDMMFEWGSTPTPYTPYNYLPSNKRMIKVSDVCQLLDKSKFPATQTINGITWTNNGDGSFAVNGTASARSVLMIATGLRVTAGKYCVLGYVGTVRIGIDVFVDSIFTIDKESVLNVYSVVENGDSANSITIKPQLFDLTEMFGAGHEPTTVAEFRQRFPNELYPYSPQCWLTSYKSAVICKTKNLFDVNKITESTNLKNNKDGTITVSDYGVSGGLLKNLCPELKVGDVIKVYFQPLRWTTPKPPLVTSAGGVIFDRNGNSTLTVTEESLNRPVFFYNNDYSERSLPGVTIIGNILITNDLTITNKNYNVRYTPYQHL